MYYLSRDFKTGETKWEKLNPYELDLDMLLCERPEFSATKEITESIIKQAKDFPHIIVETTKLKNGDYHIALWNKEFYEELDESEEN